MVTVFVYAALFETLGFAVATALMAVPVGMAFGGNWKFARRRRRMGLLLYLMFDSCST